MNNEIPNGEGTFIKSFRRIFLLYLVLPVLLTPVLTALLTIYKVSYAGPGWTESHTHTILLPFRIELYPLLIIWAATGLYLTSPYIVRKVKPGANTYAMVLFQYWVWWLMPFSLLTLLSVKGEFLGTAHIGLSASVIVVFITSAFARLRIKRIITDKNQFDL